MSRLIQELETDKLVVRRRDASDGRVVRVEASRRAMKLIKEGRSQRVTLLAAWLEELSPGELSTLGRAATTIEQLGIRRS